MTDTKQKIKVYWMSEFSSKEAYDSFIEYMLSNSEYFSFVYFGYGLNPKMKAGMREISTDLKGYKVHSQKTLNMPGMISLDTDNTYKMTIYRSDPNVHKILTKENGIFEWDYPKRPMDLAFFRNGYAWFVSVSHEGYAYFITDDEKEIKHLMDIGVNIDDISEEDNSFLFYWKFGEKIQPPDINKLK